VIKLYFSEMDQAKVYSEKYAIDILSKSLDVDGAILKIHKNEYGKPFLGDYPYIHYNISHTKGVIVCAISDLPVGVDIEMVKPFNRYIVKRCFTHNELDYIFDSIDNEGQNERYAEIWTKKEAYVKWLGKGIAIPFESFDVTNKVASLIKVYKRNQ
jgi:4'-phosphopantetheinyl transferase